MGHKEFCNKWRENAWVQVNEANGDKNYRPLIPVVDPDLTLYDNVNNVLLMGEKSQTGAKRRSQDEENFADSRPAPSVDHLIDENATCPVLDPKDVSHCLGKMQNSQRNEVKITHDNQLENSGVSVMVQDCSGIIDNDLDNSGPLAVGSNGIENIESQVISCFLLQQLYIAVCFLHK